MFGVESQFDFFDFIFDVAIPVVPAGLILFSARQPSTSCWAKSSRRFATGFVVCDFGARYTVHGTRFVSASDIVDL